MSKLLEDLKYRDLVYQQTDEEGIKELLEKESVSIYCGTDPTGNSLHIGHLLPFLTLKRFQQHGHKPVILVGGGTGIIGDPSGRSEERQLQSLEVIEDNASRLEGQLRNIFRGDDNIEFVNNRDWLGKLSMIEFLRDYGKLVNINYLLAKDSISSRLDNGLSFTEFSYTILQGIDYAYLNEHHNVKLQIGGSDQWGNITTGTELIRRKDGGEAYALVCPLITKADGGKFGKTESGNVWLDPERTSPYAFYQFWLNVSDADAGRYIRIFTTLTQNEIEALEAEQAEQPHLRPLQKRLAEEITVLVHSREDYEAAVEASSILFGQGTKENLQHLSPEMIASVFEGVPQFTVSRSVLEAGAKVIDLFTEHAAVFPSKGELRKLIASGGVSLNKEKLSDHEQLIGTGDLLGNRYLLVQKGKKNYFLITVE